MYSGPINHSSTYTSEYETQYTMQDVIAKIREILLKHNKTELSNASADESYEPHVIELTQAEVEIGAALLIAKRNQFRDLNSPITSVYIRKRMPLEIRDYTLKKEQTVPFGVLQPLQNRPVLFNTAPHNQSSKKKSYTHQSENYNDENDENTPVNHNVTKQPLGLKEDKNIKLYKKLAGSQQLRPDQRFNSYVVALGTPDLPRRHPGVDASYHPEKDIDIEHIDLLKRSNVTLQYIQKSEKTKPCPVVIFLRAAVVDSEDPLTQTLHQGHTLSNIASNIRSEKQLAITFHFAGHGNQEKVGALTPEKRFSAEEFAALFDQLIESCQLKDNLIQRKQPLIFHFDVCNSAYVDVDINEDRESIEQKVMTESMIGKFSKAMYDLGYTFTIVHGYRGYYVSMENGAGITITDCIDETQANVSTAGMNALHTIWRTGKVVDVGLPKSLKFATFPVVMLPGAPVPEMPQAPYFRQKP